MNSRRTAQHRRGFTLLELTIGLATMSILTAALGSAIIVVMRAVPDGRSRTSACVAAGKAMDEIASDLVSATSMTTMNPTELEFFVPDRDGSGAAEKVRYYWSGVAGDPLIRQFSRLNQSTNQYVAGVAATIATNVRELQFTYDKATVQLPTTYGEGSEILLASNDPSGGLLSPLSDQPISSSTWAGRSIQPTLPASAVSWRITRVKFKASISGSALGQTMIQVRTANGAGIPTNTVLDQRSMLESTLTSSYSWQQFTFTNASGLAPGAAACLIMQWVSDTNSCQIQYQAGLLGLMGGGSGMVTTNNGGSSWTLSSSQDLAFYAYGTVTTPNPASYQYFLSDVRCKLRTGSDPLSRVTTTMRLPNQPQVGG